ncbi:uncharacterized protein LOC126699983 [Quercus robur]|uniref:uncharacterized protein LOC126699983 n=1 Tax=Quercus robur TaxID=38942 RepID=UPI002163D1D9|nr:uncharacterized protein LOC126699983 [Quercus robur]
MARPPTEDSSHEQKKTKVEIQPALSFSDEDKVGTIQPHDDAMVVTLRIGGYDSPLLGFDEKIVIPKGQIRLLAQASSKVVEVNFILVDAYSPYIAIVARLWLHALGAVYSTLHLKVKYPSWDHIKELVRSQFMARQCLVAAIMHQPETESSTTTNRGL